MGQYYYVYNKTKKEYLHPHELDSGLKLLEMSCNCDFSSILFTLLANSNGRGGGDLCRSIFDEKGNYKDTISPEFSGRWAGDEIVVQGDYAKQDDPSFISESEQESYENISQIILTQFKPFQSVV